MRSGHENASAPGRPGGGGPLGMRWNAICSRAMRPPDEIQRPSLAAEIAVIMLGGAIGACLRLAATHGIEALHLPGALAAGFANIAGSFLLGLTVGHLDSGKAHPLLRPFLSVGLFGSFTTFSAFAFDNRVLAIEAGEIFAFAQLIASIVFGLAAFALGDVLGSLEQRTPKRDPR